jgi:hypothetical protein
VAYARKIVMPLKGMKESTNTLLPIDPISSLEDLMNISDEESQDF